MRLQVAAAGTQGASAGHGEMLVAISGQPSGIPVGYNAPRNVPDPFAVALR